MNDRFKIRVWSKQANRYLMPHERNNFLALILEGKLSEFVKDISILEQCTGLKDKNGKLGFQGDEAKDWSGNIWTIHWNQNLGCNDLVSKCKKQSMSIYRIKSMEIIGNIHDNQALNANQKEM